MRADDIPEYVQDGVVDCGITGLDLVRERSTDVRELLSLGFGSCRLEAAVPAESGYQRLEDLEGATVATVFPRLDPRADARAGRAGGDHRLGRGRAAPRARRRDRRPRLVREHDADERPALARHALLVPGRADRPRRRRRRDGRLDDARGRRGARAPLSDAERARRRSSRRSARSSARARRACCRWPRRAWSPCTRSCRPKDVWQLLPKLEEAGASSILVVPVERMTR